MATYNPPPILAIQKVKMETMTPQQIVKERWPEAVCKRTRQANGTWWAIIWNDLSLVKPIELGADNNTKAAWENALKNMSNE